MLEELKAEVCEANISLARAGVAALTWGNASGIDAERQRVVIKPSGVAYDGLQPGDMVVVNLEGETIEGSLRPSSDLPTHLELYRAWPAVGGIVHSHSPYATMFAQASFPIPCLGTTHADHFFGEVPVTRPLAAEEVAGGYETATGAVIVECFASRDPLAIPAVLVVGHGPFAWGTDVSAALANVLALEQVAQMALGTLQLRGDTSPLPRHVIEKHYTRKHGRDAYYGQD